MTHPPSPQVFSHPSYILQKQAHVQTPPQIQRQAQPKLPPIYAPASVVQPLSGPPPSPSIPKREVRKRPERKVFEEVSVVKKRRGRASRLSNTSPPSQAIDLTEEDPDSDHVITYPVMLNLSCVQVGGVNCEASCCLFMNADKLPNSGLVVMKQPPPLSKDGAPIFVDITSQGASDAPNRGSLFSSLGGAGDITASYSLPSSPEDSGSLEFSTLPNAAPSSCPPSHVTPPLSLEQLLAPVSTTSTTEPIEVSSPKVKSMDTPQAERENLSGLDTTQNINSSEVSEEGMNVNVNGVSLVIKYNYITEAKLSLSPPILAIRVNTPLRDFPNFDYSGVSPTASTIVLLFTDPHQLIKNRPALDKHLKVQSFMNTASCLQHITLENQQKYFSLSSEVVQNDHPMRTRSKRTRRSSTLDVGSSSRRGTFSLDVKQDTVLVYPKIGKDAVTLVRSDIDRLETGEMLNDSIIDFWLRYMKTLPGYDPDRYYMFNSFFFKSLVSGNNIRNWTKNIPEGRDIFNYDFLLIPIHEE
eukprot:TRINITY_DN15849_c0_g1_i1.p1 TRINITY_DN15849_c0_g1~~TRINITY_DN15849_c0_g1_i1.p1  ORF type:complete len:526 (-),score=109.73 TRINITY_DN15849_c0_g1_i1:10-1587(-)